MSSRQSKLSLKKKEKKARRKSVMERGKTIDVRQNEGAVSLKTKIASNMNPLLIFQKTLGVNQIKKGNDTMRQFITDSS